MQHHSGWPLLRLCAPGPGQPGRGPGQPPPVLVPLETLCSSAQRPSWCCVMLPACQAVLLNEQHLLHWFNQGNCSRFYSSAVKLHKREEELGFGFSPFQHNHLESCSDRPRYGEPAAFHTAGTLMAVCHPGWLCPGRKGVWFTHASSGTFVTMA